jgi:hypothetical protein
MKHPRQREMWEGLTKSGCLSIIGIVVLSIIIQLFLN